MVSWGVTLFEIGLSEIHKSQVHAGPFDHFKACAKFVIKVVRTDENHSNQ